METFSIAQYRVLSLSCGGEPMTINIEWQDQFGRWHHHQTVHHQGNAYQIAKQRARSTGKRHRLVNGNGGLLDLVNP